jgi:DNA-binding NarL/FixJ family response regulator
MCRREEVVVQELQFIFHIIKGDIMSISAVSSIPSNYAAQTQLTPQETASDGGAAASTQTKAAAAPKAAASSAGNASSSNNVVNEIKTDANEGMSASEIAQQLGVSVSTVTQEASAAGINLNNNSSGASTANTGNPAVGANINVTA